MITAVRIKNLRSLVDTGFVEIKPITLLLGANSTGKSTFLRSFPLYTQSVNKNLRGPISWFDDSLVDFGDYSTALNKFAGEGETIEFEYKITQPVMGRMRRPYRGGYYDYYFVREFKEALLSFSLNNDQKGTYINTVKIFVSGLTFKAEIADRGAKIQFSVNEQPVEVEQSIRLDARSYGSILPEFEFNQSDFRNSDVPPSIHFIIFNQVLNFVKQRSDRRLKKHEGVEVIFEKWDKDKERFLYELKNNTTIISFKKYVSKWTEDSSEFIQLYNMIALTRLEPLWDVLDTELSAFYSSCSYIAPTRAEANRYYRTQGLQVSDIDPYGKNLSEFISSLTPMMLNSYNRYTQDILGVSVRTKTETGHHSIMVSKDDREFNITDIGFGYSQILPIVTKLWFATNRRMVRTRGISFRDYGKSTILMEQPELHLHPAYQAKIADAFINSVKSTIDEETSLYNLNLITETHSDTILNRIGRRVREGVVSPEAVNIILFEKRYGENVTRVRQTTYNENGQIKEWPNGFFDPDQD